MRSARRRSLQVPDFKTQRTRLSRSEVHDYAHDRSQNIKHLCPDKSGCVELLA